MNVTCPACTMENAYFDFYDEAGAHYLCPDCDYKWCDSEYSTIDKEEEDDEEDKLRNFDNCPTCSLAGDRFIYQCNKCNYTGCFDEYNGGGCFENINQMVACAKCGSKNYRIVGKIGKGWGEIFPDQY